MSPEMGLGNALPATGCCLVLPDELSDKVGQREVHPRWKRFFVVAAFGIAVPGVSSVHLIDGDFFDLAIR